ncbi:MAG: hypothetical protein ABSH19_02950, partial [Opitutales bacterium]
MASSSSAAPRHRMVLVLQAGLLAAIFFVGRDWSIRWADRAVEAPEKPASVAQVGASSAPSQNPASKLAEAKADLAKILRLQGPYDREKALLALAAGLDNATLQGLLADLEPHLHGENNAQAFSIFLGQWAESDPQAALDWLKRERKTIGMGFVSNVFEAWSAKDPAAALAAISQLPTGQDVRGNALTAVIENMMAQDPQSALSALVSQRFGAYSNDVIQSLYGELAKVNPSATAAAALNLPTSSLRNAVMASVAGSWAAQDPAGALAWVNGLPLMPDSLRNAVMTSVAESWAAQDPAGALAWANGLPAGQAKNDAVKSVIDTMSEQDPSGAAAYLLQLPDSSNREAILGQVTYNWAQSDPVGLLAWASQNLTGHDYNTVVGNALRHIGATDPTAEVAALAQISD